MAHSTPVRGGRNGAYGVGPINFTHAKHDIRQPLPTPLDKDSFILNIEGRTPKKCPGPQDFIVQSTSCEREHQSAQRRAELIRTRISNQSERVLNYAVSPRAYEKQSRQEQKASLDAQSQSRSVDRTRAKQAEAMLNQKANDYAQNVERVVMDRAYLRKMQAREAANENLRAAEERRLLQQRQRESTVQLERQCNENSYMDRFGKSLA